ncbi:hypothetical protein [Pseudarthrobacter oxydans]|uniref:hypothetical protein n=1 Tax=Pseudarthrobacter oxydans TaxID=1671 RepID=UPI00344DE09E
MSLHQQSRDSVLLNGRGYNRVGEAAKETLLALTIQNPTATGASQTLLMKQWKRLWPQEFVELRRGLQIVGTGWVDEVTRDGSIIWIHLSGGWGRVMIHEGGDGIDMPRFEMVNVPAEMSAMPSFLTRAFSTASCRSSPAPSVVGTGTPKLWGLH